MKFQIGDEVISTSANSFKGSTHLVIHVGRWIVCKQLTSPKNKLDYRIGQEWVFEPNELRKLTKLEKALK